MADLNFPQNPNVGDTYTLGNRTWVWNGYGWQIKSSVTSFDPFTANRVIVTTSTNSTGTNSGGLVVYGGAGIGQDLYVGGDIVGRHNITATNNVAILGTTSSTNTTTGALTVAGGVGVGGSIYASAMFDQGSRVVTLQTLGNYGVTALFAGTDTAVSSSTGQVTVWNTSTFQTVTDRGNSTTNTIYINNLTDSVSTNTGALQVAGGVGIGSNLYVKNTATIEHIGVGDGYIRDLRVNTFIVNAIFTSTNNLNSTSTYSGAVVIAGGVGIGQDLYVGGLVNANTVTSTVSSATFGTVASLTVTNALLVSSTATTSTVIIGGLAVGKTIRGEGIFDSNRRVVTNVFPTSDPYIGIGNLNSSGTTITFTLTNLGVQSLTAGTDTFISTSTGTILIYSTATLQSITNRSTVTSNALLFSNTTNSISTTTGALVISGGLGVGGNLYGTAIYDNDSRVVTQATLGTFGVTSLRAGTDTVVTTSTGDVVVYSTSTFDSITQRGSSTNQIITFANNADSNASTQGSVIVVGGVGIGRNLTVGGNTAIYGNLQVFGTQTYIDSTVDYVTDPIIELGGGLDATPILINDGFDRGFVFHYNTSATSSLAGTNNAFLGMDNATQTLLFKTNVLPGVPFLQNTNGFKFLGNDGNAIFGALKLSSTAASVGTDSGALIVGGGIGASGNLNISGTIKAGNDLSLTGTLPSITITDINSTTGVAPTWHPTFELNFRDSGLVSRFKILTTGSISSFLIDNTPRLQMSTATTWIYSNSQAFSTATGALVVAGGGGFNGNLYADNIYSNGSLVITQGTLAQQGLTALYAGTDTAVSTSTGLVTVWNTSTLASITRRGSTTTSIVNFGANIESTAYNTGSVIVTGGVGVSGNVWAGAVYDHNSRVITEETAVLNVVKRIQPGEDISVNTSYGIVLVSGTGTFQSITARGSSTNQVITISNQTASTDTNTGALIVAGGVGIGGRLTVGNSVIVNNTAGFYTNLTLGNEVDFVNLSTTALRSFEWSQVTSATSSTILMNLLPTGQLNVFGDIRGNNIYSNNALVLTTSSIASYGVTKLTTGSGIVINPPEGVGQVQISSIDTLQSVTDRGYSTTNDIEIRSFTTASSTGTGALQIRGGVGIWGSVYVGQTLTSTAIVAGSIVSTGTLSVAGLATFTSTVASTGPLSGAVTIGGGLGVNGSIYSGQGIYDRGQRVVTTVLPTAGTGTSVTIVSSSGTTATFSINNTGVLSIIAGTDITITTSTGNVTIADNSTLESVTTRGALSDKIITLNNGQDATSSTYATLIVGGGVGISKNLVVGADATVYGNLRVFGTQTFVNSTQTYIVDPVIELGGAVGNTALSINDGFDRGLVLHYSTTATADTTYDNHSFIGMDNATQTLVYKINVYPGGTETYTPTFANTGTFGLAKFGGLTLVGGTQSTSTFTGDLIVAGGVGVGGNVNVAGNLTVNGQNVLTGGGGGGGYVATIVAGTDTAVSSSSGIISIWSTATLQSITSRSSSTNQAITITNPTNAVTPTSGALQVTGGVGVGSNLYVAGLIVSQNVTVSNSTNTGALQIAGGAGIAGSLFVGGAVTATSAVIAGSGANIYLPTTGGIYNEGTSGTQVIQVATNNLAQGIGLWTAGASYNTFYSSAGINFSTNATIASRTPPTTGTVGVSIDLSGNLFAKSGTQSLDTGSGALVVTGGAGISGGAYIGGNVRILGTAVTTGTTNGALVVSGDASFAGKNLIVGSGAATRNIVGAKIYSNGVFASQGDAQAGLYILRRQVTGVSYNNLTTDNSSPSSTNQVIMPDNSSYSFSILVTAKSTTSNDEGAWQFNGVISRYNGAGTTVLRVVNKTKIWSSISQWDCTVTGDSSLGGLIVQVKGDGANTIRFVAKVETSEVTT